MRYQQNILYNIFRIVLLFIPLKEKDFRRNTLPNPQLQSLKSMNLLLIILMSSGIESANILAVLPVPWKSHNLLMQPLIIRLAERGHNVTYVNTMPINKNITNLTEIVLPFSIEQAFGKSNMDLSSLHKTTAHAHLHRTTELGRVISEHQLKSKEMQQLMTSQVQYDVIIAQTFLAESIAAGLSYKFKAPLISFVPFQPGLISNYLVGNDAPTSYIADPFLGYDQRMSFIERLHNFVFDLYGHIHLTWQHHQHHQALLTQFFGKDAPPLDEILRNTSLVLTNDHLSISYPRPLVPNMISIGGIQVKAPKKLPQNLQQYFDKAEQGIILFSMGSYLKISSMPKEKLRIFLDAFSQLKENILCKFETNLPEKLENVRVSSWLPQSDILAHPNLKLFITHGGLLSTTEALERGVPILGIPMFADQPMNMRNAEKAGVGLRLDYDQLTVDLLVSTIRELIDNPKYRKTAEARSRVLKDQPQPPLESAVWWVEYVIRHKGAHHLRSVAQDMTYIQKHQIDVLATLFAMILLALAILSKVAKQVFMIWRRKLEGYVNKPVKIKQR